MPWRWAMCASASTGAVEYGLNERAWRALDERVSEVVLVERAVRLPEAALGEPRRRERHEHRAGEERRGDGQQRATAHVSRRAAGADEHAEREERRRGHGEEVPAVVDERMQEVRERRGDERDTGRAFRSLEPAERADARGRGGCDEREEEPEPEDASVGEVLKRDAVRLRDVARVGAEALARDLECVGTGALGRMLDEDVLRLGPPAAAVAEAERAEAARLVRDLGAGDDGGGPVRDCDSEPGDCCNCGDARPRRGARASRVCPEADAV